MGVGPELRMCEGGIHATSLKILWTSLFSDSGDVFVGTESAACKMSGGTEEKEESASDESARELVFNRTNGDPPDICVSELLTPFCT